MAAAKKAPAAKADPTPPSAAEVLIAEYDGIAGLLAEKRKARVKLSAEIKALVDQEASLAVAVKHLRKIK